MIIVLYSSGICYFKVRGTGLWKCMVLAQVCHRENLRPQVKLLSPKSEGMRPSLWTSKVRQSGDSRPKQGGGREACSCSKGDWVLT